MEDQVMAVLDRLGIHRECMGYKYSLEAVLLILEKPERMLSLVKEVYQELARRDQVGWYGIERDIRYVVQSTWGRDPGPYRQLADGELDRCPTNRQFLRMVYRSITKE